MALTRQLVTPVSMNQFALSTPPSAIGAVAPAAGLDYAGGNTAFTAWASLPAASSNGLMYVNNGSQFLWGYNGVTAAVIAYVLIGQKAGGQVEPYTTYSIAIPVSGYFWIGPVSPAAYSQQDASQFVAGTGNGGAAPGGVIGTAGVGMTCIDFNTTTTLALRLYQCGTVTP